jgi:hypothetical protein
LNDENPFILIGVTAVSTEIILHRGEPLASLSCCWRAVQQGSKASDMARLSLA